MPSDLSQYLATHYLTADPKPSTKKRKRKQQQQQEGLIIADDDETGWSTTRNKAGEDDEDGDTPMTIAGSTAEFRKAKKSGWKVLGGGAPSTTTTTTSTPQNATTDEGKAEADAILASAAAERHALAKEADAEADADEEESAAPVMMSDGTYAGLQTAATISAQREVHRLAEHSLLSSSHSQNKEKEAETVFRDATGRRVDVALRRAELRREEEARNQKRREQEEAQRGEVQKQDALRRREELEDAKIMPLARHADDEALNKEMRQQVRWGDTMAAFIKPKSTSHSGGGGGGGGKKDRRPIYKGAWQPNRYQIPPGYRWDGVDRSNGFEAERFKTINRRERNRDLDYSWQMDV
ncbi:Pre-mRNA-splicing factor of RES complex-domain-containing protein [Xylariaceae sp. FL0594]|nr:Pre-mRNA-splicing factor of RES complex-domain-containing protein [Xylariaceae sp. FL0594]